MFFLYHWLYWLDPFDKLIKKFTNFGTFIWIYTTKKKTSKDMIKIWYSEEIHIYFLKLKWIKPKDKIDSITYMYPNSKVCILSSKLIPEIISVFYVFLVLEESFSWLDAIPWLDKSGLDFEWIVKITVHIHC